MLLFGTSDRESIQAHDADNWFSCHVLISLYLQLYLDHFKGEQNMGKTRTYAKLVRLYLLINI